MFLSAGFSKYEKPRRIRKTIILAMFNVTLPASLFQRR
jgi:hypothetical protein